MKADALAKLREPFPAEVVGKLPRVTCKDCANPKARCPKDDGEHRRRKCPTCNAFVSPAHVHIDFVGHAHVTDRLLTVDPAWSWEPVAWTPEGAPAIGTSVNGRDAVMWIRLTIAGVTRPGVGSAPADSHEVEKQLIGDAIRNAAMRFGVALDLWAKADLESALDHESPSAADGHGRAGGAAPSGGPAASSPAARPTPPNRSADANVCAGTKTELNPKPKRVGSAWVRDFLTRCEQAGVTAAQQREIAEGVSAGRTQSLSALHETEAEGAMRALATYIEELTGEEPAA